MFKYFLVQTIIIITTAVATLQKHSLRSRDETSIENYLLKNPHANNINNHQPCKDFQTHCVVDVTKNKNNNKPNLKSQLDPYYQNPVPFCGTKSSFGNRISLNEKSEYIQADNICHTYQLQCQEASLRFISGKCNEFTHCQKLRAFHLLTHFLTNDDSIYIPNCNPLTGHYAEKQCHEGIGYCWCAYPDNKKVEKTVTRMDKKLDCKVEIMKSQQRVRRSQCSKDSSRWKNFLMTITKDIVYEYRAIEEVKNLNDHKISMRNRIARQHSFPSIRGPLNMKHSSILGRRFASKRKNIVPHYYGGSSSTQPHNRYKVKRNEVQLPESLTWKFNQLDKNNDRVLEDKELQPFVEEMLQIHGQNFYGNPKKSKSQTMKTATKLINPYSPEHDGNEICAYVFKDNCKLQNSKREYLKISEWQSCLNRKYKICIRNLNIWWKKLY